MSDTPQPNGGRNIGRILAGVLGFQLLLGLLLFAGDLGRGFAWPTRGPGAPEFRTPVSPGDQTRRYDPRDIPATRPSGPGVEVDGPMPDRLTLEERDGLYLLTGAIAPGDGARIAERLRSRMQADSPPDRLTLHSPGGSVTDALELGRAIREAGLATHLRASDVCLSACPYLLAAGTTRTAEPGARIGVHQHYFGENTFLPAFTAVSDIQRGQGDVMRYLDTMGVDTMVMSHGLVTPPDQIYILTDEELTRYDLLTAPMAPQS